jgi:cellulose biosynthesis protein BcsE
MATLPPTLSETIKRTAALRRTLELGTASLLRRRPASRLAIEGLADQFATLQTPGLHGIYVTNSAARNALLFDTIRYSQAKYSTLALASPPEEIAAALRERGFGVRNAAVHWPRNLNVLSIEPPPITEFEATTVAPMSKLVGGLRALKRFGSKVGALYVIEGADHWFSWHNSAALAQESRFLATWCVMRRCSVVLLLTGLRESDAELDALSEDIRDPADESSSLHGFHGAFSGVAHLLQSHGEMIWKIEFWRVNDAIVTGESLPLRFTEAGQLALAQNTTTSGQGAMLLTRDENRVVVSQAAVFGEQWIPDHWEMVETNMDAIEACRDARGVTVLLDFSSQRALADLCQTIHALRGHCGRALKIVVRERGEFMRHQYELLALSLGANLVVGRDVPFSRVQSLLESVQGQLSTRAIISDYQSALSAALSDSVCGYLTVPLFCEQVQRVIERGHVLHLPHMLLQLQLRPEISHIEALQACVLKRAGDICTADHAYIYLFLFACRVSDADSVLQRIFKKDLAHFFEDEVRYIDDIDFVEQLNRLKGSDIVRAAPDFTDALEQSEIPQAAMLPAAVARTPAPLKPTDAPPLRTVTAVELQTRQTLRPRKEKWPSAELIELPIRKSSRP